MRKEKLNQVTIQHLKKLPQVFTNEKGKKFTVTLQMYAGKIKYRLKEFDQFVPVKAYGLNLLISTEDTTEPTSYDFGYLSPEGYLVAALVHALARAELKDFDHLRKAIRREAFSWGEPVFDVNGDPVTEAGRHKRDPFVKAAKRVLKGLLAKAHKRIVEAANNPPPHNGKGMDL